ncbi:MAG TPA: NAD(P)/FAD-dependent oxidoreductase [Acidimicrobiales bacterium]
MHDVIVVGGGHNGLVCAAFLARAGKRVLVLEAHDTLGGFATTEETVAEAPGFKMNNGAIDLVLTGIPTSIIDDLDLRRHGLGLIDVDPHTCWLGPDGESIAFHRNLDQTVAEIARYSRKDAESYRRLADTINDVLHITAPYIQGHPTRPRPADLGRIVARAARHHRSLRVGARVMLSSAAQVIEEWFERDEIRAPLACFAASWMSRLTEQGSAAAFAAIVAPHRWGCQRAVGGMGGLIDSIANVVTAHGGEIRLPTPVQRILVQGDRAVGVELADGQELRASEVIAAVDPTTLMRRLVDQDHLPPATDAQLRGLAVQANELQLFKADVVLAGRPDLSAHGRTDQLLDSGCYVILAPSYDYIQRAIENNVRGELCADETLLWFSLPSRCDRTLVPPDSKGDTLYVYGPAAPMKPATGGWDTEGEKYLAHCLDIVDGSYVPGLKDQVIGSYIRNPDRLSARVTRGSIWHVDIIPTQLGPWRPIPSMSGYRTPIDGLWHTGSGAHPMGGVSGWSGRTTARTVLRGSGR